MAIKMAMVARVMVAVAMAGAPPPWACSTDLDCSLNGVCTDQRCLCDLPWGEEGCGVLLFSPLPRPSSAYGYHPNVTSWGGNAVFGGSETAETGDGKWHLFVSEIAGEHCGLTRWNSNSRVVHAEAEAVEGPYLFADVALPVEAHNPQVIRWGGEWLLFHIGDGDSTRPVHNCTTAEPWGRAAGTLAATATATATVTATASVHRSSSLRGPWVRANTTFPGPCVNPTYVQGLCRQHFGPSLACFSTTPHHAACGVRRLVGVR